MNANAFILHQSFLKILAYQMLSIMIVPPFRVLGDLLFSEILAVAHCGNWCDILCAYYSLKYIFELCLGFHYVLCG